jgi:protoheme IX farnesyltransferase
MQTNELPYGEAVVRPKWRDYLELCKPRVVALMMLTALVGMQLATKGMVPWNALIFGTLGIALMASSAAAVNHLVDQHIDGLMARTQRRPLPNGRIASRNAWYFAAIIGIIGMAILIAFVNTLTAILTLFALVGYAGVYTLYLKRATPQNIVIGGAAGAAPPMLGWTAVTGHLDPNSLLLVLIIFAWTPPHFWALAIYRQQDYAKANIPMLPVTHGVRYTKISILIYTLILTASSLLPYIVGMSGLTYFIGALLLDLGFLAYAIALLVSDNNKIAIRTFSYSILYLMMLFVLLLVDHFL